MQKITPCLWFDTEGEDAARLYTSVVPELEDRQDRALRRAPGRGRRAPS